MVDYERLKKTQYQHYLGGIVTFKDRLTAIGGRNTRVVEVLTNDDWNNTVIPKVGNKDGKLLKFTNLVINDAIYVFGKINKLSNSFIYIILGGHDGNTVQSNVWKYYAIWQIETPLSTRMWKHRTFQSNGNIWHHLGYDINNR